jgi:predicted aspartyl protease
MASTTLVLMLRFGWPLWVFASLASYGRCQQLPVGEHRITPIEEVASPFDAIRTKVDFGGKTHIFEVDTGCTWNAIDSSLKSDFPILKRWTKRRTGSTTTVAQPIHSGRLVGLSNTFVDLEEIAILDLSLLTPVRGYKVSGFIGAPVILKNGLGYDSIGKFYYVGSSGVRKKLDFVHPLTVSHENLIYSAGANIGNYMIQDMMIDTGQNSELSLNPNYFNALVDQGTIRELDLARVVTIDGHGTIRKGRVLNMELWGFKFENVPVAETDHNAIGLSMLSRFDFFIDGQTSTISLSKSMDFSAPYIKDLSGLSIVLDSEKLVVLGIREKSAAEKCGFSVGDRLVSIDGVALELNWKGLATARKHFSAYGPTSSTILVMRQDREIQLTISR